MTSPVEKLRSVHRSAPLLLQPRIYRLIEAISNSSPDGVDSPLLDPVKPNKSALTLIQDNSDSFLALMRTLPPGHKVKKDFEELKSLTEKLNKKLGEASKDMTELLQGGEERLPGTEFRALSEFATQLAAESTKLMDITNLTNLLGTLSGKTDDEKKKEPVKHSLQSKDVGGDSKEKKKEEPEDKNKNV